MTNINVYLMLISSLLSIVCKSKNIDSLFLQNKRVFTINITTGLISNHARNDMITIRNDYKDISTFEADANSLKPTFQASVSVWHSVLINVSLGFNIYSRNFFITQKDASDTSGYIPISTSNPYVGFSELKKKFAMINYKIPITLTVPIIKTKESMLCLNAGLSFINNLRIKTYSPFAYQNNKVSTYSNMIYNGPTLGYMFGCESIFKVMEKTWLSVAFNCNFERDPIYSFESVNNYNGKIYRREYLPSFYNYGLEVSIQRLINSKK